MESYDSAVRGGAALGLSRRKIEGYMIPAVKGKYYEKSVVHAFLQDVATDADDTLLELAECKKRIRELEKREESIAQALIIVKQLSEQIVSKAKTEAEKIIMESTAKQMEAEQEVARLEKLRDTYRDELEAQVKSMMTDILNRVRSEEDK